MPFPEPVLIFTWGNPSRGDDAIGTLIHDRLLAGERTDFELQTDFQLQVEHAIDLERRERVLFVDASTSAKAPFEFHPLHAEADVSYTTHAMSPQSLLAVYEKINQKPPPASFLLSVRGYEFGLGLPLSPQAERNTEQACAFILELLSLQNSSEWLARRVP